jgi:hypothetical protein
MAAKRRRDVGDKERSNRNNFSGQTLEAGSTLKGQSFNAILRDFKSKFIFLFEINNSIHKKNFFLKSFRGSLENFL